jgi:branched-chain amino acid transport system permease protein
MQIFEDGIRLGVGIAAAVYALTAIGINLQFGYTGLVNYGQVGFLMVGAYGTAMAVDHWDWPLATAFFVGMAAAIALGLLLGIPTLRLRADYLAIVTISAAEILRVVANSRAAQDVTGGPQGIQGFAGDFFDLNPFEGRYTLFGSVSWSARNLWVIFVTWGLVALVSILMALLVRSPWGRVLKAIREDEDAVRALGKNVFGFKMQSLVIGGVIGGIAGVMLAIDRQFVEPRNFESAVTFLAYAALIMGGVARILGPIVGSIILWFVISASESFLRQAIEQEFLGIDNVIGRDDVGPVRFMLVGLLIMLLVIFRPQGVFGNRNEVTIGD